MRLENVSNWGRLGGCANPKRGALRGDGSHGSIALRSMGSIVVFL